MFCLDFGKIPFDSTLSKFLWSFFVSPVIVTGSSLISSWDEIFTDYLLWKSCGLIFNIFYMRVIRIVFYIFHVVRQNFTWITLVASDTTWIKSNVCTSIFHKNLLIFIHHNSPWTHPIFCSVPFEINQITICEMQFL